MEAGSGSALTRELSCRRPWLDARWRFQITDPKSSLSAQVDGAFAGLEQRSERILAGLRLLALFVLALVFRLVGTVEQGYPTMVPLGSLTVITVITLVLARRHLIRSWLLWLFATLDVSFLIHCLVVLGAMDGRPLQLAFDTPAALLIFVFLATSAVRHRPLLVLCTDGLFIAALDVVRRREGVWPPGTLTVDVAWLAVVGMTTYALFVAVKRARRASTTGITESHLRENLSRYFSPQLVEEMGQAGAAARSFRPQKAAILFADLRGFTGLAEGMPADRVAEFLNEFRRRIAEPIARHRGVIDKFIGDARWPFSAFPNPARTMPGMPCWLVWLFYPRSAGGTASGSPRVCRRWRSASESTTAMLSRAPWPTSSDLNTRWWATLLTPPRA